MARTHARINVELWQDEDFRDLPREAQHLYFILWTHPALSYCGVVDWRPGRIAAFGQNWTALDVLEAADCLQSRLFIVTDDDTEECLIRSWAKWDGLLKEAKMSVSWANAYAAVASSELRGVIVHEARRLRDAHPEYVGWTKDPVRRVLDRPAIDPASRTLPKDVFRGEVRGPVRGAFRGSGRGEVSPPLEVAQGPGKGSVKGSPTPAPAPTPSLQLQSSSPTSVPHQGPSPVPSKTGVPRGDVPEVRCTEHAAPTDGCAVCWALAHVTPATESRTA